MTRVTESLSTQLPDTFDHARARVEDTFDETAAYLEETAARIKESEAADNARRIAAVVATSVARGAGAGRVVPGSSGQSPRQEGRRARKGYPHEVHGTHREASRPQARHGVRHRRCRGDRWRGVLQEPPTRASAGRFRTPLGSRRTRPRRPLSRHTKSPGTDCVPGLFDVHVQQLDGVGTLLKRSIMYPTDSGVPTRYGVA